MTVKFEVGKTYVHRSYCDGDEYIEKYTVKSRTNKTITVQMDSGPPGQIAVRRALSIRNGVEKFKPDDCTTVYADSCFSS